MTRIAESPEFFVTSLCQKAEDLGASEVMAVAAADIVLDERAQLKCLVPICPHYGVGLLCPPHVMPVSRFREILRCYHSAILIKLDFPAVKLEAPLRQLDWSEAQETEYFGAYRNAQKSLIELTSELESLCFEAGYRFAAGLVGGGCMLCEECVGAKSGLPCRHPFKARPPMEAMGIDVIATAEKVGLPLTFGPDANRSMVGMILVF